MNNVLQEINESLGAADPCDSLYDTLRRVLEHRTDISISSEDNSIQVIDNDLSLQITSTDNTIDVDLTGVGKWDLVVADTDVILESTPTIDVVSDPYRASLAAGSVTAGSGIQVDQLPDSSFTVSALPSPESPFGTDNIRYVALTWSTPPTTGYHFTTFADAYTSILTETPAPSSSDPYTIFVYPGFYSEVVNAVSNVNLVALGATRLDLTWVVGQGVNAPNTLLVENLSLKDISIFVSSPDLMDSRGKVSGTCLMTLDNCSIITSDVVLQGRSVPVGHDFIANDTDIQTTLRQVDVTVTLNHCRCILPSWAMNDNQGSRRMITVTGGSVLTGVCNFTNGLIEFLNVRASGDWLINSLTMRMVNSAVDANLALTLILGSLAYFINTPYREGSLVNSGGTSAADRSTVVIITPELVAGNNVIPIALPYLNSTYRVMITPVLATAVNTNPVVVARASGSLTLFSDAAQAAGSYELVLTQPEFIAAV